MDIDKATDQLGKVDGFLTSLKNILRKHWGLLLLILFGWCVYWAFTTEDVPEEPAYFEEVMEEYEEPEEYGPQLEDNY